jgi:hypothetical protein
MGPLEAVKPWQTNQLSGVVRFRCVSRTTLCFNFSYSSCCLLVIFIVVIVVVVYRESLRYDSCHVIDCQMVFECRTSVTSLFYP